MFKRYPLAIIILFCLFIYRLGMSELTSMELGIYTAIVFFAVFFKKKKE